VVNTVRMKINKKKDTNTNENNPLIMIQKKEKEHTVLPFQIKEEEASSYSKKIK